MQLTRRCIGLDRFGCEMPAKGTRARHRTEEPKYMAGDCVNFYTLGQFTFNIRNERKSRFFARREWRRYAKDPWIDVKQPPGLLVRSPPHHHAVQRAKLPLRLFEGGDATVQDDVEIRMRDFQSAHERIVERRHVTIFTR